MSNMSDQDPLDKLLATRMENIDAASDRCCVSCAKLEVQAEALAMECHALRSLCNDVLDAQEVDYEVWFKRKLLDRLCDAGAGKEVKDER